MALTRLAHRFASRSRRIAVRVAAAALLLLPLAPAPPADADVVELRTGERVEGTFKGADDETVRIEVAGRVLTFKPQLVRAIYYGSVPSPAPPALPERGDALKALQAIRSVARDGVGYREYARQVGEAPTVVDRYLEKEEAAAPFKNAIADSFHLYALAGAAWNASASRGNYAAVGSDAALLRCASAQRVIAQSKQKNPFIWRSKGQGEAATTGMVIGTEGITALWECASDKLAEAERRIPAGDRR